MKDLLAQLRARLVGSPKTTIAGVTIGCVALAIVFGTDAVTEWQDEILAGGGLAAVVLGLLKDPCPAAEKKADQG